MYYRCCRARLPPTGNNRRGMLWYPDWERRSMSAAEGAGGDFVVIGAGPAGLTTGYELAKLGFRPIVLEQQNLVGGLASTAQYRGSYIDMGGHVCITKVEEVKKMWQEVLRDNSPRRPRSNSHDTGPCSRARRLG